MSEHDEKSKLIHSVIDKQTELLEEMLNTKGYPVIKDLMAVREGINEESAEVIQLISDYHAKGELSIEEKGKVIEILISHVNYNLWFLLGTALHFVSPDDYKLTRN